MIDHGITRKREVRAANLLRDVGIPYREPLRVRLVDHRAIPRRARRRIVPPRERVVDDDALRHAGSAVRVIHLEIFARASDLIREQRIAPLNGAADRLRIRIDEQLIRIEAVPCLRRIGTVHAISVQLSGAHIGEVAVPDLVAALEHRNAMTLLRIIVRVEQAQRDSGRVLGKDRKVDALSVPRGAQRIRLTGPDTHQAISR